MYLKENVLWKDSDPIRRIWSHNFHTALTVTLCLLVKAWSVFHNIFGVCQQVRGRKLEAKKKIVTGRTVTLIYIYIYSIRVCVSCICVSDTKARGWESKRGPTEWKQDCSRNKRKFPRRKYRTTKIEYKSECHARKEIETMPTQKQTEYKKSHQKTAKK